MLLNKRRCGKKLLYVYKERLKRKKEKHILLKGRVVHRVMQLLLTDPKLSNQIHALSMRVLDEYVGEGVGNTYERAHAKYEFPTPNNKRAYFTWDDFAKQIISSVEILWSYVVYMKLKPLVLNMVPQIEQAYETADMPALLPYFNPKEKET